MIVYDLECTNCHTFEGWFQDRKAFEDQARRRLIACPVCGDTSVVALPSKISIKAGPGSPDKEKETEWEMAKAQDGTAIEKVIEFFKNNFEDVGPNFAAEALKMHYNVADKRNIRGTGTETEMETLRDEGIEFFRVPIPRLDS